MAERRPGRGRYARVEREQRWVLADLPGDARLVTSIVDRYIHGTRLRLRQSEGEGGVAYKLGQKVRDDPADPEVVRLTNIYLSVEEHQLLSALPAGEVRKSRFRWTWFGHEVAVDRFLGRHDGLVLAEVELDPDEAHLPLPPWASRDVTSDDRFSGGALALAGDREVAALVREVAGAGGGPPSPG